MNRPLMLLLGWLVVGLVGVPHALASEAHHDEHNDERHDEATAFRVAEFAEHGVAVATAGPGVVDLGVELPAMVHPNADRLVHLSPRYRGVVRETRKDLGDSVQAGDVLAVIESDNLATFELRARLAGTVIEKHIVPGEVASPDRASFVIADLSDVWVDVSVYPKTLTEVRVGQRVIVTTPDESQQAEGSIRYVSPTVDPTTGAATARVVLPNPNGGWRPGAFAIATLAPAEELAVVVPSRALLSVEGRDVVFVVEGEHFEMRPVSVGRRGRTRVEIRSGLTAGDQFADEGAFLVKAELGKGEAHHAH